MSTATDLTETNRRRATVTILAAKRIERRINDNCLLHLRLVISLEVPVDRAAATSASLPSVARTGTVDLAAGEGVTLSIATNIREDALNIYQN